jgi:diaminopimelate epimerase
MPSYSVLINNIRHNFGAVSMGNPHIVIQVDDFTTAPVNELGAILEKHSFFPERANIGFMQIVDHHNIKLRVYERGTAETLACGSGACAAAVIAIEQDLTEHNVNVALPGGVLGIAWKGRGQPVMMTGSAVLVFDGSMEIPSP